MELLYTAHVPSGEGPFPTILALHGWGASAHDLLGLAPLELAAPGALARIWGVTALWISVRSSLGLVRIWPGQAGSPLRRRRQPAW